MSSFQSFLSKRALPLSPPPLSLSTSLSTSLSLSLSRTGSKLGITPLMLAAMNGHTATVKLLLDMGSDINAQVQYRQFTACILCSPYVTGCLSRGTGASKMTAPVFVFLSISLSQHFVFPQISLHTLSFHPILL